MQILNIAGYKFIELNDISTLRLTLLEQCQALCIKGTILLSQEGINISLAGEIKEIQTFQAFIKSQLGFADLTFHETYANSQPFRYLKVKIKKEIITLKQPQITPCTQRAPSISANELKQWLDEKRDFVLLDTRNEYEVKFGSFETATTLAINDFSELPNSLTAIEKDKPLVMFCTGGIRCEKAALYMLDQGYSEVYQLDGGILGYFNQVGGEHYQGECFVFDERIALDTALNCSANQQCNICQNPVSPSEQCLPSYIPKVSCPACRE